MTKLEQLRRSREITLTQLEQKLHINRKTIRKWERVPSSNPITVCQKLAQALGVNPKELF